MSSREEHPSSSTDPPRQGFTDLFIFLRDAFRQGGLVSIPPEILQPFKQCPRQNIDCPEIAQFARLFEGTRSSNRFRLEANSFIYTVQILFHLRPSLVQERILHLLMASVRLLKDEKDASQRLSALAGREINCYSIARKRTIVSKKLLPWLLKHFSQDSTTIRLKTVAAQFIFYLLQGDEEAKKIFSCAPPKERWSLGRTIGASPQLPLRVLAANMLREISLTDTDVRVFWPPEMQNLNDVQLPSGFIADTHWLCSTIQCLHILDSLRSVREDCRAKIYEILSIAASPLHFTDSASKIVSTVSEHIFFLIPANQKRPLQILEIPLTVNMKYERADGTSEGNSKNGQEVELQLQLRDTGFYILNGLKSAIDRVNLNFSSSEDCDRFCQAINDALQNLLGGLFTVEQNGDQPRPKKQSRSVMIDLSQDVIISGDTQLLSPPLKASLKAPPHVSNGRSVELSASRESPLPSPIEAITEYEAGDMQMDKTSQVRVDEKSPENAVAPAVPEPIRQDALVKKAKAGRLPQQMLRHHDAQTEIDSPVAVPSTLQQSVEKPAPATPNVSNTITYPEGRRHSAIIQSSDGAQSPSSVSTGSAKSPRTMALKASSAKQLPPISRKAKRKQPGDGEFYTGKRSLERPTGVDGVPDILDAVDWDEDLRSNQDWREDEKTVTKRQKRSAAHGPKTKTKTKKPDAITKVVKPSSSKKKPPTKAKYKERNPMAASVNASLAATRPRRTAASVSYEEQSEPNEQSQDTVHEPKDVISHTEPKETHGETLLSIEKDRHIDGKRQPTGYQTLSSPVASSTAKLLPCPVAAKAAAGPNVQKETLPAQREHETGPERMGNAESDPSKHNPSSLHERESSKTGLGHRGLGRTAKTETEVVDDSHPMDKQQRANAISATRKSFGSALTDMINQGGMELVRNSLGSEVVAKPFSDNGAFFRSAKTAFEQRQGRAETKSPNSERQKNIQMPPTNGRDVDPTEYKESTNKTLQPVQLEESIPHQQFDEGIQTVTSPLATNAALPMAVSECPEAAHDDLSPRKNDRPATLETQKTQENIVSRSHDIGRSPPSLSQLAHVPNEIATGDKRATASPLSEEVVPVFSKALSEGAIPIFNREQKRRMTVILKKPEQSKRARMAGSGPKTTLSDENSVEGAVVAPQPTVSNTDHGTITVLRTSEPSVREGNNIIQGNEAPTVLLTQRKPRSLSTGGSESGHPESESLESAPKLIRSECEAPQAQIQADHPAIFMDDHLHRKAQIVGFSIKGPRNQGVASSGKREHEEKHSHLVPNETGGHMAFKRSHADAEVIQGPRKRAPQQSGLFDSHTKRKILFPLSDRKSAENGISVNEESAEDATPAPATSKHQRSNSVPPFSKVDENGSPRLHLQKTSRIPSLSNEPPTFRGSQDTGDSVDAISTYESPDSEHSQTTGTVDFGLEAAVSKYTAAATQMAARSKSTRNRPSIGLERLLNQSFPYSSKSIDTNVFKQPTLAGSFESIGAPLETRSANHFTCDETKPREVGSGGPFDGRVSKNHVAAPSFDIDQLRASVAPQQPSSAKSARVRRLRSKTPLSHAATTPEHNASPPSFDTRLRKMIMPPPLNKPNKIDCADENQTILYKDRETSVAMDAETTLVNGEHFEEETSHLRPQGQQLLPSSSPMQEERLSTAASHPMPGNPFRGHQRYWNKRVTETQQSVTEILEQLSHKLLLRFSCAENSVKFKVDCYRYGGHKVLNNLVEQFDKGVTREKEMPSSRISEYRDRLQDTTSRLQEAKKSIRIAPSLDDLGKSHDKRSKYVLINLEKFAAAQR